MRDPKVVLTESGMKDLEGHLWNLEQALDFIMSHADDFHIGMKDPRQSEILYEMQELIPTLRTGDGETND